MKNRIHTAIHPLLLLTALLIFSRCAAQNIDISLLRDINRQRNPTGDKIMTGLTNSVYPVSGIIPVAELITGYARHDKVTIQHGWETVAGLGVNAVITFGLKDIVGRNRPYVTYPDIQPYQHDKDASFPSGHTSFSFYSATSLSLCYPQWYVIVPAYLWAGSVGYSRMYLGMHYPTDVLAGAVIGTGTALLAYKGNKWLQKRKRSKAVPAP